MNKVIGISKALNTPDNAPKLAQVQKPSMLSGQTMTQVANSIVTKDIQQAKQPTTVTTTAAPQKYEVTECYYTIKNMFAQPAITELYITAQAWTKLMCFIHLVGDYEISGFGRIQTEEIPDGQRSVVTDFDIIKQEVKSAYVESDAQAVMDFLRKIPADQRNEWTLDWHSHVNMGTTPSGTDWTNYKAMLSARMQKQFPAMIVNKSGNVTAHQIITDAKHPEIKVKVIIEDLTDEQFDSIYKECKEKVETLCRKAAVTTYSYGGSYGWNDSYYKGTGVGFQNSAGSAKKSEKGPLNQKRWWEEDDEEEDEDVRLAEAAGYVFNDMDICPECGCVVEESDRDFKTWGICTHCLDDYKKEGIVERDDYEQPEPSLIKPYK